MYNPRVQLKWFDADVAPDSLQQIREIMWELSELGFRYELLALDCHFVSYADKGLAQDTYETMRRRMIQAVCADRPAIITALPTANIGLAAPDLLQRAPCLEALRQVISRWPTAPEEIKNAGDLTKADATTLAEMENILCRYYVQTFWETAGRAATIPRTFPVA